jgi:hypothetical protein
MEYMFSDGNSLSSVFVSSNWNTNAVISSKNMLYGCFNLPNFNSSYVDKTRAHYNSDGYLTYKEYNPTTPNPHTSITPSSPQSEGYWISTEIRPQTPISDTTFKLYGTSDYGTETTKLETTNTAGRVTFTNIELGTYTLEEIVPNSDYILNTTKWTVKVDEQGNVSIIEPEDETLRDRLYTVEQVGNNYVIFNEPRYWNFTLRKIDKENETIWLEGAEFTLTGISDLGTEYNEVVESNENGRVVFNKIEKGTYILKETKAPIGVTETGAQGGNRNYITDGREYIVKIDNQGNVTINGLNMNQYDDFVVKNDRAYDGKITIVKKWEDNLTNDERPEPVVHLSTNEPNWKRGITVTKVWEGDSAEDRPEDITVYLGEYIDSALTPIMTSQDNFWTKNSDNTWTYTFDILLEDENADKEFYVWEEDNVEGYKVINNSNNPVLVENQVATITNTKEKIFGKYAVSLMGIGVDTDENGNTMGLTFGPATGDDANKTLTKDGATDGGYVNAYKSHTPTGTTADGNAHRCLHDDDWNTIIYWNNIDPYVYEQCISENCTHSVELHEAGETIINSQFEGISTGDGPSALYQELLQYNGSTTVYENLRWHPNNNMPNDTSTYGTNYGGWGTSRIRAMLNGADSLTDVGDGTAAKDGGTDIYASIASTDIHRSASVYTSTNNLLATFPQELQDAIGKRATKYDSVCNSKTEANLKTSYDKLWLLSPNEIWSTNQNTSTHFTHPLEGAQYERFVNENSGMTSSTNSQNFTKAYRFTSNTAALGSASVWWLRSSARSYASYVTGVAGSGYVSYSYASTNYGVAPCFSLSR